MFKSLLLLSFAVATLVGTAALAHESGTGQKAAPQTEVTRVADRRQKAVKIRKTNKRISGSLTQRQCWSEGDPSSCKFCRPTYDGYCRCEQHFPCE
jgi:hypothetical protein